MHGAYASLLSLGEDIRPPAPDPEAALRFAFLSHVGRLVVECQVSFDVLGQLGIADATSTPRTSTQYLTPDELPLPRFSDDSSSFHRFPSPLRPRGSSSAHQSERPSSSHRLRPSSGSSPPSRLGHSTPLNRPSVESLCPPPGSSTFGEIRPLRLSASAEPLRRRRPSFPSPSDLRIRIDTPPESPSPSPQRSFHVECGRTVLATYAQRPRSLNSDNSVTNAPSGVGARRDISRPFPLRPMPLSPELEPLSPTDLEVPKVNSYPKRGLGRKIKRIASKLSLTSVK